MRRVYLWTRRVAVALGVISGWEVYGWYVAWRIAREGPLPDVTGPETVALVNWCLGLFCSVLIYYSSNRDFKRLSETNPSHPASSPTGT